MIKLYAMRIILAVLGAIGAGGYFYYVDTQERMATLRENNAKLEVAVQTSEASIKLLESTMKQVAEANNKLQRDLQKAEAYGDELRGKLNRMNLVQDALRDAKKLEGKMNGATAKLWRGIMEDTGGDGNIPLPHWLQSSSVGEQTGSKDGSSDQSGEGGDTNGRSPETSPTG
jgi:FtsZ-binding cell division protein ZapB